MKEASKSLGELAQEIEDLRNRLHRIDGVVDRLDALIARTSARPVGAITRPGRERSAFDPGSVKALYSRRFSERELTKKRAIWRALAPFWAKRFPKPALRILEIGAGEGEFLDHADAARRVAIDINPAVTRLAQRGIEAVVGDATSLYEHFDNDSFDVVFCSNVLEHLYDKDQIHLLFREIRHVLRPGGRALILQPNIRYVGAAYYDFIDHRLELTADSVVEALEVAGFTIVESIDRFLPYTTKSHLSHFYWLVPLYVHVPLAWRLFGAQAFVVAEKQR